MNNFQEPVSPMKHQEPVSPMEHQEPPSRSATAVFGANILLKEIMKRLPARQLRFSLVDKRWRRITSGPNFSNRHSRHHCNHRTSETAFIIITQLRLFYFNPTTRAFVPFSFTLSPLTTILQCSHGLMLLECRDSRKGPKYYCVANPITRRARKLEIQKDPLKIGEKIVPFFLSFDPSKSEYYKVGFMRVGRGYRILDVYDSESREWQQRSLPDINIHANTQRRICLKNGVYSVSPRGTILDLNIDNLKFGTIRNPSMLYDRNYVVDWNRNMYCISIYSRTGKNLMLMHLLLSSRVWSLLVRVVLNRVYCGWPEMKGHIAVLGITGEVRARDFSILFHGAGKIVAYSIFYNRFELLLDLRPEGRQPLYLLEAHLFKETLSLV